MAQTDGVHDKERANRIRVRALLQAGEPADPPVTLLHRIAREIIDDGGLAPLKAHRLAWGWTVERAVERFHAMCEQNDLGAHGLTIRSWRGWEAGTGRPNDQYRDLLCRLFETSGVMLGFASDYTPHAAAMVADTAATAAQDQEPVALEPRGSVAPIVLPGGVASDPSDPAPSQKPVRSVTSGVAGLVTDLPRTSGFVGRDGELSMIDEALAHISAVAVAGRRGIGTSACAVQAANRATLDLSGGRFYLDLRPGARPLLPREVLGALASWTGVDPPASASRAELTAAANRVRRRLAGIGDEARRGADGLGGPMLLVLDNVDEPSQVDIVLPLPETCRVLLSGTPALEDLPSLTGVTVCPLEEPSPDDALDLCVAAASTVANPVVRPDELRAAPMLRELVELLGRQPLLLRTLGRETARLGWDLDEVAAELHQAGTTPFHQTMPRSDALAAVAGQDVAYSALSPPARRLLRLLSLSPECFGRGAIGALLGPSARRPIWSGPRVSGGAGRRIDHTGFGTPTDRIDELLGELSSGRFIDGSGGRYQVRKLLAPTARFHLLLDEPVGQRIRAQRRVLRHLARQAARQAARLHVPPDGGSGDDPMAWFAIHHHLLRSLVIGGPSEPRTHQSLPPRVSRWRFHLAEALCGWYEVTWRLDEWAGVCRAILSTPGSADDPRSASWAHNQLGVLHRRQGELGDARHQFVQARSLRRGSRRGTAQVLMNEGLVLLADDEREPAVQRLRLAGQHRPSADRLGRALTDLAFGVAELASGDVDDARSTFARAARMFGELDDPRREGAALTNLGLAQWRRGERAAAADTWEQALEAYDRVDDPYGRAAALLNLGASQLLMASAEEDVQAALAKLGESEHLWTSLGAATPSRGRTLLHKGDAQSLLGRQDEARLTWKQAGELCLEAGDDGGHAAAVDRLREPSPKL